MEKLKIDIVNKQNNGGSKSPSNCNPCDSNKFFNNDYYAFVVVQTLKERDKIPCKLRQNGMVAVVVEEGFNRYQLQTTFEFGVCDNRSWILNGLGDKVKVNFIIVENLSSISDEDRYREGVIFYNEEDDKYYRVQNSELVDLFPKYEDPISEEFRVTAPAGSFQYGDIFPKGLTSIESIKQLLTTVETSSIVSQGKITLGISPNSLVEVGTNLTVNLTATADRGSVKGTYVNGEWDKDSVVPYRGNPLSYKFLDNYASEIIPNPISSNSVQVTTKVKNGNNTYTAKALFDGNEYFLNSNTQDKAVVVSTELTTTSNVVGGYRRFSGPINSTPTNGTQIRTALLSTSVINTANNYSFNSGTIDNNFVIAIPSTKNLSKVVNQNTNEDLTSGFVLSSINTIPDAGGTNVDYKVYVMTNAIPFGTNQTINVTLT